LFLHVLNLHIFLDGLSDGFIALMESRSDKEQIAFISAALTRSVVPLSIKNMMAGIPTRGEPGS
jgi:hypothetical protein